MTTLNNWLLCIAIIISAVTLWIMFFIPAAEKNNGFTTRKIDNRQYCIIVAIITFIAVFVRIYQFGLVPGGFNQDGAMAAVDAKALADYHTDRFGMFMPVHLTAWGYGQMSSLMSYLMAPFIKIFGLCAVTARLPILIFSLLGLVCLFLFVKDTFGKNAAIIIGLFAAINPWHILQSRWALDCNLYPHFFIIGIYLLHKALNARKRILFLILSMISFGLCMYCYGISIYTMPLFLLVACIYLLVSKKISIKEAVIAFFVYLIVATPFILVMAINFFKWDTISTPFFTMPFFPDSVRSNDILFFSDNFLLQLKENFKSLMAITLQQKKDLPWNDIENFGTMYLFSIPFAVTGLIVLIKKHRANTGAILTLFFLLTGVWCGLTTNNVNINRLNIIYYPIIILAGLGIYETITFIKLPCLQGSIFTVYTIAFLLFINTYFTTYAEQISQCFFKDFGNAVSSLKETDTDKLYITADSQYVGAYNVSEILTMFYLETDAEYFQEKTTPKGELPYSQKFQFFSNGNISVDENEDAAYVVTDSEISLFDAEKYDIQQFGNFYSVTKK